MSQPTDFSLNFPPLLQGLLFSKLVLELLETFSVFVIFFDLELILLIGSLKKKQLV